jgi:hypothetical protein
MHRDNSFPLSTLMTSKTIESDNLNMQDALNKKLKEKVTQGTTGYTYF